MSELGVIPHPGNVIVVFFRNGVQLEGEVISWSDDRSVLKSPTGASTIIIQKTLDDVMFYKFSNAKTEYEKLRDKPHKEEDDIKAIAALKNELNDLERAEARERLTSHKADGMRETNYGLPLSNITIKGSIQRPRAETPGESPGLSSGLQGLFSKKH